MTELPAVLGVTAELVDRGWKQYIKDFEKLFIEARKAGDDDTCTLLSKRIDEYFLTLQLPSRPTLYDMLVMSLRPKDMIISFNWDPLIVHARRRSPFPAPAMCFPHGNVALSYCSECKLVRPRSGICPKCQHDMKPSELLYPQPDKNYDTSPFIRDQFELVKQGFRRAGIVTIFGYSSPSTDVFMKQAISNAWGTPDVRDLEEIEFIDIRSEMELYEEWRGIIHSHHYHTIPCFKDSWLNRFPRRTHEAFWDTHMDLLDPYFPMCPPETHDWAELRAFYARLTNAE